MLEIAVQVNVTSKTQAQFADQLLELVILKTGVLDYQLTAHQMHILWMAHHVTTMRLIASQENARHTMHNARHTS